MLFNIYRSLLSHFGPQNWWPAEGGFQPREWEICIGAILTQNTNWKNVEKALSNLKEAKALSPEGIAQMNVTKISKLIRPSGYFRQKAGRLKEFARFVLSFKSFNDFIRNVTREQLLQVNGIGRETADSILLYACGRPVFVIDAYTRRILSRAGMIDENLDYDDIRLYLEYQLGSADDARRFSALKEKEIVQLYNEFHALLVALGKNICTKSEPACGECPISDHCRHGAKALGKPAPSFDSRGSLAVLGGH